jgi:CBS domain containing-hemolysin-like protein
MIFLLDTILLPCFFLFGSIVLTACSTAFLHMGKFKSKEFLRSEGAPLFFYLPFLRRFFPNQDWENLYFSLSISKHIFQLSFAVTAFFYAISRSAHLQHALVDPPTSTDWGSLLETGGIIIAISLSVDFLVRLMAHIWSRFFLRLAAPFASFLLILLFPIVGTLLRLTRALLHKAQSDEDLEQLTDSGKLREMITESELHGHLDASDQKLISSFLNFKQRVTKEIMVPRVNLYALDAETSIREATSLFARESYSRIPIYKESLDDITGVVLYKDLLHCYANPTTNLDAPLQSIAKPVLYAPENKKITHLLQEFRTQQIHMAIIVDEYGGTEGIVTIEDILEELVGEIEDEFDINEDRQFWEIPGGGWIVDARMTLLDIEDQLGIQIPPDPEYETIGGYIFHCAGTIPSKGWHLSHDAFDLEILSSDERSIKKIKISPRNVNLS